MPMVNGKFSINPAQAKMSAPPAEAEAPAIGGDAQSITIDKSPDGGFITTTTNADGSTDQQQHASCDEALAAAKATLDAGEPDGDEGMAGGDNDGDEKDSEY
jgi:hypothetical protein